MVRPNEDQSLTLDVSLVGDYGDGAREATGLMATTWKDLADAPLGNLLGLSQPQRAPEVHASATRLDLSVVLDPKKLFDGPLRNATIESFDNYSAVKVSKLSKQADLLAKISFENVKRLRYPKHQKTPDWARKVFEEKIALPNYAGT